MFNVWRNFFVDPESGLPWATVMMFPWLKYGIVPSEKQKVAVKIPETMKKTVSLSMKKTAKKEVKQEVKKEVKKTTATKTQPSEKKLPVKAATTSLIKVEKKLPAVKVSTEVKKTATAKKTATSVKAPLVVENKTETPKKETAKKAPLVVENKAETPKKETAEKAPLVVEKKADTPKKESVKPAETLPLDLPTPPKKTESKKKKVSGEEVQPVVIVERKFTPINTDKMPVKVQNLITQTNPSSPKAQIREAIVLLCADWAEPAAIADILKYKTTQLETLHLTPMVNSGQLLLRYPQDLTHPEQAYRAVSEKKSK